MDSYKCRKKHIIDFVRIISSKNIVRKGEDNMKCEWCLKIFDYDSIEELFELEMPTKLYRNFEKTMFRVCDRSN